MKEKDEKAQGCECEDARKEAIEEIIENAKKPTRSEHKAKEAELEETFKTKK